MERGIIPEILHTKTLLQSWTISQESSQGSLKEQTEGHVMIPGKEEDIVHK